MLARIRAGEEEIARDRLLMLLLHDEEEDEEDAGEDGGRGMRRKIGDGDAPIR